MKNRMLCPVLLLVGIGIGIGIGMLISKPKIDEQKEKVDQLITQITQVEAAKTESEETIRKAATEIARNKSELTRMKSLVTQLTGQLGSAKAELQKIKTESPVTSSGVTEPEVVITTPSNADRIASTVATVDYTVEDGDSFWKIAQEQLGDGLRYTEILELNPTISENQTLIIGTKIKIPTQ